MPYIRSITFILFIGSLILPILGVTHPSDYVASVVFFSLFVWLLALLNDFISALIALILSAFFTQRMLLLYIDPGMFKYQWVSTEQMTEGAFFCLTVIIGIYLASLTYGLIVKSVSNKPPKRKRRIHFQNQSFKTVLGNVSIDQFVKVSSWLVLLGIVINMYFVFSAGIGAGSLLADRSVEVYGSLSFIEKILSRLGPLLTYLMVFALVVFVDRKSFTKKTKNIVYFAIFTYVLHDILILTSRGTLIWIAFSLLILTQLVKSYVSKSFLRKAAYLVIFTVLVVFAGVTILRPIITDIFLNQGVNVALLLNLEYSVVDVIVQFSNRLSAFDPLVGIMSYPGDLFQYSGSLYPQFIQMINSFTLGNIFSEPDFIHIAYAMPVFLDGQPVGTVTRELPGGLAVFYISFGWAAFAVYYMMMFFLRYIYDSNLHIFYKIIIFLNFSLIHFSGGLGTFKFISDRILVLLLAIFVIKFLVSLTRNIKTYAIGINKI